MDEDANHTILVREILVAVDSSSHSRAALRAAVTLAKVMEADIRGLFVHEEHWSRISQLSSLKTINELTGESQVLEEGALEQQIGTLKRRLQRQLKQISQKNKITHSWQTARGKVSEQILEASKEADLITIGLRGRSFPLKHKLGSTARAIIDKADKPILILKQGLNLDQTITAVYDGSEASRKVLALALSLAEKNGSRLSVLAIKQSPEAENQRSKSLERLVDNAPIPVTVTMLEQPDVRRFLHAVNSQQSGLVVIPKDQPFLQRDLLETTLNHLYCPVLMIN